MSAIRLARGVTSRNIIVKFEGCYHGHADALLVKAGSGVATLGIPGSAGVPEESVTLTLALPYNDLAAVEAAFAANPDARSPASSSSPSSATSACIPPAPGYLEGLRAITQQARRAAHLRRGHDRLPRRPRRRLRALRHQARPHLPRQNHRRRPARRRLTAAAPKLMDLTRARSAPSTRPARSAAIRSPWPPASPRSAS